MPNCHENGRPQFHTLFYAAKFNTLLKEEAEAISTKADAATSEQANNRMNKEKWLTNPYLGLLHGAKIGDTTFEELPGLAVVG